MNLFISMLLFFFYYFMYFRGLLIFFGKTTILEKKKKKKKKNILKFVSFNVGVFIYFYTFIYVCSGLLEGYKYF